MSIKRLFFGTDSDANPGVLILRVFIGAALMTHGWGKLFGGLDGFTDMVANLGIPAPAVMALLAALAETLGALLLILGALTRLSALMIAVTMAVAALAAHGGEGFAAQEMAWLYFVPALFFVLKGAGRWSLDEWIMDR